MSEQQSNELTVVQPAAPPAVQPTIHPITILERAIQGGVTKENVEVVKELVLMVREQRAEDAKAAFAAAFFQLRKHTPKIEADKQAKTSDGSTAYIYCSEEEISKKLEPHLLNYGFAMLFGQSEKDGRITVNVTLIHEKGHQETREYSVRAGSPNKMKDAAMCDAGGATTAWRHLMIKMFGLKSRIQEGQDAKNIGQPISLEEALKYRERVKACGINEIFFLQFAQVVLPETANEGEIAEGYKRIGTAICPQLNKMLQGKERQKQKPA